MIGWSLRGAGREGKEGKWEKFEGGFIQRAPLPSKPPFPLLAPQYPSPVHLPYLPGGLPPPLPPFTQLKLTRDRRLPLAAAPQKCLELTFFKWNYFAKVF